MKLVDRKTGAIVDVPDDKAQAAFMSGAYGVPKDAPMPVKTAGMPAGTVDATDAGKAFGDGARVATEDEYRRAQADTRHGGVAGALEAGAVGAARGLGGAFGVPVDAAAIGLAEMGDTQTVFKGRQEVDPYKGARTVSPADALRERLRALDELHPVASTAGELGGMAGAALLGGGALGAVGRGAEAVAGTGLAGAVARTGAEGALLGLPGAFNEAALGDENVTAAKVLASVGHGALIGGTLGGGLHLGAEAVAGLRDRAGRFISSLRPQDIDRVAAGHFGYAPKGLGEKVQEAYAKVAAGASGKDSDVISKFTELSPEGAEARRIAVFDAPKIQEEAERAVRKHIDDLMGAGDLVSAEARGGLKADYVKRSVARGNEREVQAFASKQLDAIISGAQAQLDAEMAPSMVKSVETVSKLAYRAQEALASGDNAEAFIALDNAKRGMQRLTSTGYRSLRAIADPVDQLNAKRTVAWLDGAAADLRAGLENEGLWGKAAVDQRAINAAWTKQIDASKRFHKSLTTEVGRDPANPYIELRGADPAKVASYVKGLTNPHNDLTHAAVRDFVQSTEDLSKAIRGSYDLPADKLAEVERVASSAAGFRKTIDEAEHSLVTANQYRALLEAPEAGTMAGSLGAIGGIVGGLPGGLLGSIAGGVLGAAQNPGKTVAKMAALERLASKVDSDIAKGVRSFLSGGKPSGAVKPPSSVALLEGKGGSRKVFESKVKEVQRLAGNQEELNARVREFTSQFEDAAPNVATALTAAAIKGANYLAAHAPPGFTPRPEALEWGIQEEPLYTDAEMREWSRRAAVVNDPREVLRSMKRKMLTPEEAHALREVHAPIFEQMQREFRQQRIDKPGKFTYAQSLQIELAFGVPLTRTLEPGFMRDIQAAAFPVAPPKPKQNFNLRMAKTVGTQAQQLAGGY